jgi:hypothetical protein
MQPRQPIRARRYIWKQIVLYACLFSGCDFNDDMMPVYDEDVVLDSTWHAHDKHDSNPEVLYPNNFPFALYNNYNNPRRNDATSTDTPSSNQPLESNDSCHPPTSNIGNHTTQRLDKMSPGDFKAGCCICTEEDAYKKYKAVKCPDCGQCICEACYGRMKQAAHEPYYHDYHNGFLVSCNTPFRCPCCRKPYY